MQRALDLARSAAHRASPNPMVGCVVVRDGEVVGRGVTQPPGQAHAEAMALEQAGDHARGADMYVTLEPCCHHGRTPPCTDAVIRAGIRRVFAGALDPNPVVHGVGMERLAEAGLETHVGLEGAACERFVRPFARYIRDGRPWVLMKAAVSLDGRIATDGGDSKWITGEAARADVHAVRARCDAVMVGAETALSDDPRLTVRLASGADPLRVVLDSSLRLPPDAHLVGPGALVFHAAEAEGAEALQARGAETVAVPRGDSGLDLRAVLGALASRGVVTLLVEGGGRLHGALVAARLVDEARLYVAPKLLGTGRTVLDLPSVTDVASAYGLDDVETLRLGDDVRIGGLFRYPAPSLESS